MSNGRRGRLVGGLTAVAVALSLVMPGAVAAETSGGFSGRVTDWQGKPVAGAKVVVWNGHVEGSSGEITTTDSAGYYSLDRPAGWYAVAAEPEKSKDGFETTTRPLQVFAGSRTTANVVLRPAGGVTATVKTASGQTVSWLNYRIDPCSDGTMYNGPRASTRDASFFTPGRHELCIDVTRWAGKRSFYRFKRTVTMKVGEVIDLGVLKLPKSTGVVTGRLHFAGRTGSTGYGDNTVAVALETLQGDQLNVKYVDLPGSVTFKGVPPGRYRVIAIGTNASRVVTVKTGGTTRFRTFTHRLSTIAGTVRAPKKDSACVEWYDRWGYGSGGTCGSGTFTYRFVGPVTGTFDVRVGSSGRVTGARATVTLKKAGATVRRNFVVKSSKPLRTFSGKVVNAPDAPPAAEIRIPSQSGNGYYAITVKVRKDGTFSTSKLQRPATRFSVYDRFDRRIATGRIAEGTRDVVRVIRVG